MTLKTKIWIGFILLVLATIVNPWVAKNIFLILLIIMLAIFIGGWIRELFLISKPTPRHPYEDIFFRQEELYRRQKEFHENIFRQSQRQQPTMSVPTNHHYQILGVSPADSSEDIRKAYLSLVKKYHPDVSQSPKATERLQQVNQAYAWMKKNHTRKKKATAWTKGSMSLYRMLNKPQLVNGKVTYFVSLPQEFLDTGGTVYFMQDTLEFSFDFPPGRAQHGTIIEVKWTPPSKFLKPVRYNLSVVAS